MLAAILADGTNLGLERMADSSQGVTYAQLAWTQAWYLSEETTPPPWPASAMLKPPCR